MDETIVVMSIVHVNGQHTDVVLGRRSIERLARSREDWIKGWWDRFNSRPPHISKVAAFHIRSYQAITSLETFPNPK